MKWQLVHTTWVIINYCRGSILLEIFPFAYVTVILRMEYYWLDFHKNMTNTKAPIRYLNETYKSHVKSHGHLPRSLPCKQVLEDELLPKEMCLTSVRAFSCSWAELSERSVFQNMPEDALWVYGVENNSNECLVRQQCWYLWNLMERIFLHEANLPFCTCVML